jgi:hypothetical protein
MWTGHGDVFAPWGNLRSTVRIRADGCAVCRASRAKPAGEGTIIESNAATVESLCGQRQGRFRRHAVKPRKGYICLNRRGPDLLPQLAAQELPSSNPAPDQVATIDQGFHSLYTGVDLSGWKEEDGHKGHWTSKD